MFFKIFRNTPVLPYWCKLQMYIVIVTNVICICKHKNLLLYFHSNTICYIFIFSDMKERLSKIITAEGLTPALLADKMGIQRSGISHILSGRNYPSFDFLQRLLIQFPKLNADWLILGQGSMYKTTDADIPDIFLPSELPKPVEKTQISPTIPEKPQNLSFADGNQKKLSDTAPEISPPPTPGKIIEKIFVFYNDKTFATYFPEIS